MLSNPATYFQHWSEGIAIIQADLSLSYYNPAWLELMQGYAQKMGLPKPPKSTTKLLEFIPTPQSPLVVLLQKNLNPPQATPKKILSLQNQNQALYWAVQIIPLANTASQAIICIVQDVTASTLKQEEVHHLATLQERDRLARELHDSLAQSLGYLNLKLSLTLERLKADDLTAVQENLRELKHLASETYTDVREEIFSLRTTVSSPAEFYQTLNSYLQKYRQHYQLDVKLNLKQKDAPTFSTDVGNQLIRILQEALINIRKHAQVTEAFITVESTPETIQLVVEDRGQGFDLSQLSPGRHAGYGLQIMRERAASVGGELHIQSKPGAGSKIVVVVPLEANTHALTGK